MIVTAGTTDGQSQHGRPDGADDVVQFVVAMFLDFVLGDLRTMHAGRQKPGRHHRQIILRRNLVTGQLPFDERVVRQIIVQCPDHKIAEMVGRWTIVIVLETVALGEAGQIEPMTSPSFPIMRTGQKTINQFLNRIRR